MNMNHHLQPAEFTEESQIQQQQGIESDSDNNS